jgi:hypothetical protein
MALSEAIRDVLAADVTLAALLVGGIYSHEQTGRNGISRVTTPDAYEADGFLRACAVVKAGEVRAGSAVRDSRAGMRQAVAVSLYDDGDNGYGAILTARDRAVALLDRVWVEGAGFVRRIGGADEGRDAKLNQAALVRVDFEVTK